MSDTAAQAIADAEARKAAHDNPEALTAEQVVDLALGRTLHTPKEN